MLFDWWGSQEKEFDINSFEVKLYKFDQLLIISRCFLINTISLSDAFSILYLTNTIHHSDCYEPSYQIY